jgi:single-strand DNA-binding protein
MTELKQTGRTKLATDLNRCEFIGRLGKDPEVRYTADNNAICNFSIAVGYKTPTKETTEWVRITAFGKLAGICSDYLKKGSQVFIAGRMTTRKWQNKDGVDQYTTEVVADQMQMLGGRPAEDVPLAAPAKPKSDAYRAIKEGNIVPFDDFEDTVPF